MVEWESFFNYYNAAAIFSRTLNPNALILFNCGSYGDVFPNMSLLAEVVRIHKKPLIVILDKKWVSLIDRFKNTHIEFILINNEQEFKNSLMSEGRHYIFRPGWIYPLLPTLHPLICDFVFEGYVTDFEIKKTILHLPKTTKYELPQISDSRRNQLREQFKETGARPGKTCIVSFGNNSNPSLPQNLIVNVINRVLQSNVDVLLNVASTFDTKTWVPTELEGLKKIHVPPDAPNEYIEIAGFHLGSTNGLSTILTNYLTKAKIGVMIDCTDKFITNNGRLVESEWWLPYSKSQPQDINKCNKYSEFIIKDENTNSLLDCVGDWIKK
jgi:hypothetical protein